MTATNHALTGAVIAVGVQQPLIVIPLALMSHFVLDALPHFGIQFEDPLARNTSSVYRIIALIDGVLFVACLFVASSLLRHHMPLWVLLAGMIIAFIPDVAWLNRYRYERRTGLPHVGSRLTRWHASIQRFERPWGIIVEIVWAITAIGFLVSFA